MEYKYLFQKGKIGNVTLKNRVVMTAMGTLMGDWNGCTTPEQVRFYEDRARGGCGLIIPEFTCIDADSGHCNAIQLGIYDSRQIKSFELICEAVHRHGAKISSSCSTADARPLRLSTAGARPWPPASSSTRSSDVMLSCPGR